MSQGLPLQGTPVEQLVVLVSIVSLPGQGSPPGPGGGSVQVLVLTRPFRHAGDDDVRDRHVSTGLEHPGDLGAHAAQDRRHGAGGTVIGVVDWLILTDVLEEDVVLHLVGILVIPAAMTPHDLLARAIRDLAGLGAAVGPNDFLRIPGNYLF